MLLTRFSAIIVIKPLRLNYFQEEDMVGTAEWFAEREEIYRDRNRRIEDVCNNLLKFSDRSPHLYKSPTQGNSFWFDLSHHLAVCMHPKVRIS